MKYRSIICTIILVMVLSITVGFSAFVSEMSISKIVADVRVEKDVRITSVAIRGAEVHNADNISTLNFDEDSILFDNMFASLDDYIELSATITNIGSAEVGVFDIVVPNGIGFEITNYNIGEKLCDNSGQCNLGSRTEFIVRIFPYSEAAFDLERVNVDFDFRQFYDVTYKNILKENHKIIGGDEIILRFGSDMPTPSGFIIYENDVLLTEGEDYELYADYLWVFNIEGDLIIEAVYEYKYDFIDDYHTFVAPVNGKYRVELWGSGGVQYSQIYEETVGKGGYVAGTIELNKGDVLYIYVGSASNHLFNGAGPGEAPGGGATDVRLVAGAWNDFSSLKSRIMVAGAGGGGVIKLFGTTVHNYVGDAPGHGGGLVGYDANFNPDGVGYGYSGYGGTQTAGGKAGKYSGMYELTELANGRFGSGGFAYAVSGAYAASGGGGGYYGGGHGVHPGSSWPGAGGGSSYISGHYGCIGITFSSTESNIIHSESSTHYSGYRFSNTTMIDGAGYRWTDTKGLYEGMPTFDGQSIMSGNAGNGYAKIKLLSDN